MALVQRKEDDVNNHDLTLLIEGDKAVFAGKIREYVRAQKALWQQVPWHALFADDGLGGYRDNDYSLAYYSGFWRIRESSVHPTRAIAVDCASGELVYASGPPESAPDRAVYRIGMKLALIDAEAVLHRLEWESQRPSGLPPPTGYDSLEEWQQNVILRTGLTKFYERRVS